jgi:predicted RNA-binding protein with TRAM domain
MMLDQTREGEPLQERPSIEGWVVVVTGASSGNGKAISLTLASSGVFF